MTGNENENHRVEGSPSILGRTWPVDRIRNPSDYFGSPPHLLNTLDSGVPCCLESNVERSSYFYAENCNGILDNLHALMGVEISASGSEKARPIVMGKAHLGSTSE